MYIYTERERERETDTERDADAIWQPFKALEASTELENKLTPETSPNGFRATVLDAPTASCPAERESHLLRFVGPSCQTL